MLKNPYDPSHYQRIKYCAKVMRITRSSAERPSTPANSPTPSQAPPPRQSFFGNNGEPEKPYIPHIIPLFVVNRRDDTETLGEGPFEEHFSEEPNGPI
jgi:hypothetical protein